MSTDSKKRLALSIFLSLMLVASAVLAVVSVLAAPGSRSGRGVASLAFIRNGDVYVLEVGANAPRKLTNIGFVTAMDALTGGLICYATRKDISDLEAQFTIETINSDGSGLREVKRWTGGLEEEPVHSVALSPDGSTMVYTHMAHQLSDYFTTIIKMDMNTGGVQVISEVKKVGQLYDTYSYASFLPSGQQLVCLHARIDDQSNATVGVATMNTDGSNPVTIYEIGDTTNNLACPPTSSPDGSKFAFIGIDRQPWTVNSDGNGAGRVTNIGTPTLFTDWSPDSSLLAFASTGDDDMGNIYSAPSGGGNAAMITGDSTDKQPRWYGGAGPRPTTSRTWATDSIGTSLPATDWYLAEGCTATGFETWVLVQNPDKNPAKITITYMTPDGPKRGPAETLGANSRKTYNVADSVPNTWEVSTKVHSTVPVIVERSMYGNHRTWGTDSIGIPQPAKNWYLAEGCTATGFETWIMVQNPNDSPAIVEITFMTADGPVAGPSETLDANSRRTYCVADFVPDNWGVSTRVSANKSIVAERSMYGDPN